MEPSKTELSGLNPSMGLNPNLTSDISTSSTNLDAQTAKIEEKIEKKDQETLKVDLRDQEIKDLKAENVFLKNELKELSQHVEVLTKIAQTKTMTPAQQLAVAETNLHEDFDLGEPVIFVNHSHISEKATIKGIDGNLATLEVQGAHPNDKRIVTDVPFDAKRGKHTFHAIPLRKERS